MGRWVITGEVERYTLLCGEMGHYWGGGEVHTVVWGDGSLLGRWRGTHCCVGRWVITGEVERYTLLCGEMGHYWGGGEVHTVVWGDGSLLGRWRSESYILVDPSEKRFHLLLPLLFSRVLL